MKKTQLKATPAKIKTITLQPIAMITPNQQGIYAPSRLEQPKTIDYKQFLKKYADHPRPIKVSFEPDGKSLPQVITAYGFGLDCWYIVSKNKKAGGDQPVHPLQLRKERPMEDQLTFTNILTGETVVPNDWKRRLKPGDYYAIEPPTTATGEMTQGKINWTTFDDLPTVYGHIESDEDCEPGFFWVRGYSQWCPDGELGLLNICEPTRQLTAEEFNQAQAAGWPSPAGTGRG